jgi:hypothetical protein
MRDSNGAGWIVAVAAAQVYRRAARGACGPSFLRAHRMERWGDVPQSLHVGPPDTCLYDGPHGGLSGCHVESCESCGREAAAEGKPGGGRCWIGMGDLIRSPSAQIYGVFGTRLLPFSFSRAAPRTLP